VTGSDISVPFWKYSRGSVEAAMSDRTKGMAVSGEEIASHSIRANHELITDLCLAKEALEQINHDLPDIFGLMAEDGRVVRGNTAYARLAKVDDEDIGDTSLRALFTAETWKMVQKASEEEQNHGVPVSLELPIDAVNPEQLFHWTFSSFKAVSDRRGRLRSFIGKDITKLREIERKLASIFAAIPLGVITINKEHQIEWPYSAYSEILLGRGKLESLTAEDGLFGFSKRFMNQSQLEAVRLLFQQIGAEEEWYDMAKDQFPKEIPFGTDTDLEPSGWRSLTYNPIVREGRVEKILVVVEDITDRVRQRLAMTSRLTKEQKIAQIIFDLQETDTFMMATCIEDIQLYMDETAAMVKAKAPVRQICNKLHGIKGVARTLNLSTFKNFVHEMEDRLIRHAEEVDRGEVHRLQAEFSTLDAEWQEALKYIRVFQSAGSQGEGQVSGGAGSHVVANTGLSSVSAMQPTMEMICHRRDALLQSVNGLLAGDKNQAVAGILQQIRALTFVSLNVVSTKLEMFFEMTAKKLGKEASLVLEWGAVNLDATKLASTVELFYHLITNALDHGIESPDARVATGKSRTGRLVIAATDMGDAVTIECQDDGGGIDEGRVLEIARSRGLIDGSKSLTGPQVWNLILMNGFSTAAQVTDTSGRGIGLDAVNERVKSLGGDGLKIQRSVRGQGTSFIFTIPKA
jgi:PAS domain-containing protein/HPt (histidine-containing phosphotransfer) domain-containing protein